MHIRNEEDEHSAAFICCVTKLLAPGGAAFGKTRKFTMREAKRILGTDLAYMIRKSKKGQWTNDETGLDKTYVGKTCCLQNSYFMTRRIQ